MESSTIEKIFKALEWIMFLGMLVAAALFVQNSFQNYQSYATGIQVLSKKVEDYVSPTITLCFKPYRKSSILQEYDLDHSIYPPKLLSKTNETWPDVFQNISYNIGKDFNLTIVFDFYNTIERRNYDSKITISGNFLTEKASKLIEFEELITVAYGKCFSITVKNKTGKSDTTALQIQFDESMPSKDIPKLIEVIITSKQNSYGVLANLWKEGKEFKISIDPEKKDYSIINLQLSQYKKLEVSSNCSIDDFYWNCLSKR